MQVLLYLKSGNVVVGLLDMFDLDTDDEAEKVGRCKDCTLDFRRKVMPGLREGDLL